MKHSILLKDALFSILFFVLILVAAYDQRGYWSIGAEIILPMILFVVLLKGEKKENGS